MKISVFTPVHKFNDGYLSECAESVFLAAKNAFGSKVEWIVLLNGHAIDSYKDISTLLSKFVCDSLDIVLRKSENTNGFIGALKAECCEISSGDILVELDFDDRLTPGSINIILGKMRNGKKYFFSDSWRFLNDNSNAPGYSDYYGWKSYGYTAYHDSDSRYVPDNAFAMASFPALPQYLRRIEWSPDHVRAFRKDAYIQVGGYDKSLEVGDDHDLICRFYLHFGQNGFYQYPGVLYHYRVHGENTSGASQKNALVQHVVDQNYIKYAEKMFIRWANDNGLSCLDLGGRFNCPDGYQSVDLIDADVIIDLNQANWPIADNSVGVLRAYHIIEHLDDQVAFFNEAYRVLAPGGLLLIEVPSSNGMGAFSDPTHKSFFNIMTFEYYTNKEKAQYIRPKYTGNFQKSRVVEYNWDTEYGKIPIVSAQLISIKGWYKDRYCGELKI